MKWELDQITLTLKNDQDKKYDLSKKPYIILAHLKKYRNKIIKPDKLMEISKISNLNSVVWKISSSGKKMAIPEIPLEEVKKANIKGFRWNEK